MENGLEDVDYEVETILSDPVCKLIDVLSSGHVLVLLHFCERILILNVDLK